MRIRNAGFAAILGCAAVVCAAILMGAGRARHAPILPGAAQARRAPIVLLISLDGFRWDQIQRPGAVNLRALAARGVRAKRLVPAFPTKTYPNHHTIVTGLYPEHHGIIANVIFDSALGKFSTGNTPAARDGRWYGGEPIWVTAEKQQVRSAVYFWPGSETEIRGVRPTWHVEYHEMVSRADRVRQILTWLALPADRAPRFVTLYFEDVDTGNHRAGPGSARADSAIVAVDSAVGAVVAGIARLGMSNDVNVIVVSDHGSAPIARERTVFLDDYVSMDSLEMIDTSPVATIIPKPGRDAYVYSRLKNANPHLAIYRKEDVPARFHFNNHARITPIVGIAGEGWTIATHVSDAMYDWSANMGNHGFDNALSSMGALFVAAGPAFRQGVTVPPFQSIHIYPLLAAVLGIRPARVDGSIDSVRALLRR